LNTFTKSVHEKPTAESSAEMTKKEGDIEAGYGGGSSLYPNMMESPQLRWAFIRKVYSIVALQILLTIAVAGVVNFVEPVRSFLLSHTTASLVVYILIIISPFLVLQSAALTATVVVGLTLYTFWAAKRGYDFNFLGPFLCAALIVLMLYCIIQVSGLCLLVSC
ncbi:hypothetical protein BHM03_00008165, partial [Ensete ventricosum]